MFKLVISLFPLVVCACVRACVCVIIVYLKDFTIYIFNIPHCQ